jgi:hypothetical protein
MNARPPRTRAPLYSRLLHLKYVHPNSWQRAVLGEGAIVVGGILVLADLASLWVLLALPFTVAAVVKGHDLLAGLLAPVNARAVDAAEDAEIQGWVASPELPEPALSPESEPVVAQPVLTDVVETDSAVRVIPAPSRRAAARPGAAAARAQVTARRPRRKANG